MANKWENFYSGPFNIYDIIWIVLPTIIGFCTQAGCPIGKDAGASVKFRPPAVAFTVIWVLIFIAYGFSWSRAVHFYSENSDRKQYNIPLCITLYALTLATLAIWIGVYGCKKDKKGASWVLLVSLGCAIMTFTQGNDISKILLSPLIAWGLFALLMNTTEVQIG